MIAAKVLQIADETKDGTSERMAALEQSFYWRVNELIGNAGSLTIFKDESSFLICGKTKTVHMFFNMREFHEAMESDRNIRETVRALEEDEDLRDYAVNMSDPEESAPAKISFTQHLRPEHIKNP